MKFTLPDTSLYCQSAELCMERCRIYSRHFGSFQPSIRVYVRVPPVTFNFSRRSSVSCISTHEFVEGFCSFRNFYNNIIIQTSIFGNFKIWCYSPAPPPPFSRFPSDRCMRAGGVTPNFEVAE